MNSADALARYLRVQANRVTDGKISSEDLNRLARMAVRFLSSHGFLVVKDPVGHTPDPETIFTSPSGIAWATRCICGGWWVDNPGHCASLKEAKSEIPGPDVSDAQLSKLLWEARELADMYADIVAVRMRRDPNFAIKTRNDIDQYRAERGWSPNGFGGEH